jgi:hypothetical protein
LNKLKKSLVTDRLRQGSSSCIVKKELIKTTTTKQRNVFWVKTEKTIDASSLKIVQRIAEKFLLNNENERIC